MEENAMGTLVNRRRFQRFELRPMYAPISVRVLNDEATTAEGHAYDISEGGVRFEIEERLAIGTALAIHITLPSPGDELGPGPTIMAFAQVAWVEEEDEHPPYRCAATFTSFARFGDRERLLKAFSTGRYRLVG
jgi:hypothetical protein